MMEFKDSWDCEEFSDYLREKGVHCDPIESIVANRIDSGLFISLSESDLKELAPVIGDRICLRKILEEARKSHSDGTVNPSQECVEVTPPVNKHSSTTTSATVSSSTLICTDGNNEASEWHVEFLIPELNTFSHHVRNAINTGIVTGKARREIIQVLRTYMTAHTIYPSSEQYKTVCRKLISKYPKLKDNEGKTKYSSWKLGLRTAFKNFRRGYKKTTATDESLSPPSKRVKVCDAHEPDISEEEYQKAIKELQEEYRKGKKGSKHSNVKHLMEVTKIRRHLWIRKDHPLISEVIENFPHLQSSRWVRREFKAVICSEDNIYSLLDNWQEWREKIIQLSKLESTTRPLLKKLLGGVDKCEELTFPEDGLDTVCLDILTRMLYPRGIGKAAVFLKKIECCDVDVDFEISEITQPEPFLLITGEPGMENCQVFICCEGQLYLECKSIKDALLDLISTYFVFDIIYPKNLRNVLLFIQHYVFNLRDEQLVSSSLTTFVTNLEKIE